MTALLVPVAELATFLGLPPEAVDAGRAGRFLVMAQRKVLGYVYGDHARPAVLPDALSDVILTAAARIYTNPSGMASETTGPFAGTFGGDAARAGSVYLTVDERETLDPFVVCYVSPFGSVVIDNEVEVRTPGLAYPYDALGRRAGAAIPWE